VANYLGKDPWRQLHKTVGFEWPARMRSFPELNLKTAVEQQSNQETKPGSQPDFQGLTLA
jgi:hypothetical protein